MPDLNFVAFDLETTGLSPKSDRIIEIGAVRCDLEGRVFDTLQTLVDPGMPIPLAIQRLTGITDADVTGSPTAVEAVAQLADFSGGAHLVAHGAALDIGFCASLLPDAFRSRLVLDTLELARILMPLAPSHSLVKLSASLEIEHARPHRALSDAAATQALFVRLASRGEQLPAALLARIRQLVVHADTAIAQFFLAVVAGDGRPGAPAVAGPQQIAPRPRADGRAAPAAPLATEAVAALGPSGPLASETPDYELREAQIEMGRAVAQTLDRGSRLLVEAGTGVGKSLAYLVPLALWSQRSGRRAVVATQTITLQEQLAERELPRLRGQLGLPVTFAMLKGRHHYISLRRLERFLDDPLRGGGVNQHEATRFALKLLCWLAETRTGDRAELRLAGVDETLWRRVASETGDCIGAACANWRSGSCYMVAARRAAVDADIVVTNHALLLADAERQGQVLSDYSALVVDEAHRLEESATRQLGARLVAFDLLAVVDRLVPRRRPAELAPLDTALAEAREGIQRLFGELKGFLGQAEGGEHGGNISVGLSDELRRSRELSPVVRAARHAIRVLRAAASALQGATGTRPLQATFFPQPDRLDDELELAAATLAAASATIEAALLEGREGQVAWIELRAENAQICTAPVDVAEPLAERVFDRVDASVLTSATLSVAGSFDFVRRRTGVGMGAEELLLSSPFDFLAQALCVLPTDVPPYADEAYDAALAGLCEDVARRLGGRTMVLFTGYAALRAIHARLGARLESDGIAVLGQGLDGTRRQVLHSFLDNPRTVLLGTSSFWEGIDIPGEALRCVIVAKLPFPVPTDPLVQARAATVGDPFGELALPLAVLRLKQGFGRLIRRGTDRGAVVLCDARLRSRDYGATFLRALPRAAVASEPCRDVGRIIEDFVLRGTTPSPREGTALAMAGPDPDVIDAWYADEPA